MSQLTIKNTNINIAKIADLVQWFIYQKKRGEFQ